MQSVPVPNSIFTTSLKGRGIVIIRGRRGIGPGPIRIFNESKPEDGFEIESTSVKILQLRELTYAEVKAEDFEDVQSLKRYLKNTFGNLDETDNLTVIRWNP